MTAAIKAENLAKSYVISHRRDAPYGTLRDAIAHSVARLARRNTSPLSIENLAKGGGSTEEFWALRDVNFEIAQGDRVGIIGRNGAGKSTLLKILSRITEPTRGRVELSGRVASLLEVGTGFHPELTGRENISLNAAILGMSRAEVSAKFDEIVEFAEVEKFLDTPVKRYSSGMYVRLAFAVAAHLDPDILIVDEVLAVGDRKFQEKCLGRMESLSARDGRTVLFVSHNLDAIQRLCKHAVYLREGQVAYCGKVGDAIDQYLESQAHIRAGSDLGGLRERWGSGRMRITGLEILDRSGSSVTVMQAGEDYEFVISYVCNAGESDVVDGTASLAIANSRGVTVLLVSSEFANERFELSGKGGQVVCRIGDLNLVPGEYAMTLFLGRIGGEVMDCLNDAVGISVAGGDYFGTGHPGLPEHCSTLFRSSWRAQS